MIADQLRRSGKPITPVANKSENLDSNMAGVEFHALGLGEPVAIAAVHGRGVKGLINTVLKTLPEVMEGEADDRDKGVQIAVVGRPNVGKSTLVNRLLGEERVVAFDQPGTTRDSVFVPFYQDGRQFTLIDTAGVRYVVPWPQRTHFTQADCYQGVAARGTVVMMPASMPASTSSDASPRVIAVRSARWMILSASVSA